MDEGVGAFPIADHRVAPFTNLPADVPILRVPGPWPVEHPVAQDDALDTVRREHCVFNLFDRLDGGPYGRGRLEVERCFFRLHRPTGLRVPVGGALNEKAADPRAAG